MYCYLPLYSAIWATHYSMYLQGRKKKNSEFMPTGSRRSPGGRKHRRGTIRLLYERLFVIKRIRRTVRSRRYSLWDLSGLWERILSGRYRTSDLPSDQSWCRSRLLRTDRRRNTDLPLYKRRRRNSSRQGKYWRIHFRYLQPEILHDCIWKERKQRQP